MTQNQLTELLEDFAYFVIALADDTGLPLSEALHEAATVYPALEIAESYTIEGINSND
jgi:hypothetical protein